MIRNRTGEILKNQNSSNLIETIQSRAMGASKESRQPLDIKAVAPNQISIDIEFGVHGISLLLVEEQERVVLTAHARTATGRRHLRNSFVGLCELRKTEREEHLLDTWDGPADADAVWGAVQEWLDFIFREALDSASVLNPRGSMDSNHVGAFWWDKRTNFGDAIGPWIVARTTGKVPVNTRGTSLAVPSLMSVGSILGQVERTDTQVWGTGLIEPLRGDRLAKLKAMDRIEVRAVRGKLTRQELVSKAGWTVPEVYGDPGLLLPRYIDRTEGMASAGQVAVVPHYAHVESFKPLEGQSVHFVDVEQGLEQVVREIAAADAVVSTSLHGLIIAQAYEVPWIWLRITDSPLMGDQFKFEDFFSTLSRAEVSIMECTASQVSALDLAEIGTQATLPAVECDLDALAEAFPLAAAEPQPSKRAGFAGRRPQTATTVAAKSTKNPGRKSMSSLRKSLRTLKKIVVEPRRMILVDPKAGNKPIDVGGMGSADLQPAILKTLQDIQAELKRQRRLLEVIQSSAANSVITPLREHLAGRQLGLRSTLERLATTEDSFVRFGDGEFRLAVHPEADLPFQRNSEALGTELQAIIKNPGTPGLMVGFPHVYTDANWSKIWLEIWNQLEPHLAGDATYGDSHVTRPIAFSALREEAVELWRKVWDGKSVLVVSGKGSRFELLPELFDNVRSVSRIDSTPTDAFEDLPRVMEEIQQTDADLVLIALGPAGTVLGARLAAAGRRAIDIGHLSDSYANVFAGASRPERKPVSR